MDIVDVEGQADAIHLLTTTFISHVWPLLTAVKQWSEEDGDEQH